MKALTDSNHWEIYQKNGVDVRLCLFTFVLMVRRSTPASVYDDQTFAVRVRFTIPERGFSRLNEAHDWLRQRTNRQYAFHAGGNANGGQCAFLYVNDLAVAMECVARFEMELVGLPKMTP